MASSGSRASFGMSHDQVAARIGKSRPYVSNAIRLLDLPPAVLEMIERGELSGWTKRARCSRSPRPKHRRWPRGDRRGPDFGARRRGVGRSSAARARRIGTRRSRRQS